MKKLIYMFSAAALMLWSGGCTDENQNAPAGEGSVHFSTSFNDHMTVKSRALSEAETADLSAGASVWISSSKGLVRKYDGLESIPENIGLMAGSYVAEAWDGDSVPASWDQRWFKAYVPFKVEVGKTTDVNIECKIANVAVGVEYPEGIDDILSDVSLTVGFPGHELTFEGTGEETVSKTAYFMMPSTTSDLNVTLKGKQMNNDMLELKSVIKDVEAAHKYLVKIQFNPSGEDAGGFFFKLVVEDIPDASNNDFEMVVAPLITGYGFDINEPINVTPGKSEKEVVYISSAINVTHAKIVSDVFKPLLNGVDEVELIRMTEEVRGQLDAAGFSFKFLDPTQSTAPGEIPTPDPEEEKATLIKVSFAETLLNTLEEGTYQFVFTAIDGRGQTTVRTLTIKVTNAMVSAVAPQEDDLTDKTVTLRGKVMQEGVEKVGFNYRLNDNADWQFIEGTPDARGFAAGTTYSATISGLEPGTTVHYAAVADDYVDAEQEITTLVYQWLPNSSFEDFNSDNGPIVFYPSGGEADMFWDSGNHGSWTMKKNVTMLDTEVKHSGNYSLKMASQKVGISSLIGKFAAGNIFAGKYLATDGTDGILGWGRPWTTKPKGLRGYVKYRPVPIDELSKDAPEEYQKGDMDKGIIKIALTSGETVYENETYAVIVKTKSKDLFDENASYVYAYGEQVFTEATPGEGMVEFDIKLNRKEGGAASFDRIIVVASASKGGDYFTGGNGSIMWIDDVQVYY